MVEMIFIFLCFSVVFTFCKMYDYYLEIITILSPSYIVNNTFIMYLVNVRRFNCFSFSFQQHFVVSAVVILHLCQTGKLAWEEWQVHCAQLERGKTTIKTWSCSIPSPITSYYSFPLTYTSDFSAGKKWQCVDLRISIMKTTAVDIRNDCLD